jgi:hypothetical protein
MDRIFENGVEIDNDFKNYTLQEHLESLNENHTYYEVYELSLKEKKNLPYIQINDKHPVNKN